MEKHKFTFLSYIESKDKDKLTAFIWNLPYRIEIKSIEPKGNKWVCWFVHGDNTNFKTAIKNLDLDKL